MNERDREYLKTVELELSKLPEMVSSMIAEKLLSIIDRLDDERIKQHDTIMNYRDEVGCLKAQLQKVKEAGEALLQVPIKGEQHREAFHRLAQALKEVKNGLA